jgi:Flp pilus assembly protein protease CpaA
MVQMLIAISSIYISWVDLREHRIYNRDLISYALLLSLDSNLTTINLSGPLIIFSLLVTVCFHIGGGDFKLIVVLLLVQGEVVASTQYLYYLLVALSSSILLTGFRHRTLHCTVPLAPAIALPFLLIYLGI